MAESPEPYPGQRKKGGYPAGPKTPSQVKPPPPSFSRPNPTPVQRGK